MVYTKMLCVTLLILISFCFFSCATLTNGTTTAITVRTTEPTKIVYKSDTLRTNDNALRLVVPRSEKSIYITTITDSITNRDIRIKSRLSSAFYGNFVGFGLIGFAVDWTNPKRFTYPKDVYLYPNNRINNYLKVTPVDKKGRYDLIVSIPHVNWFMLNPEGEPIQDHVGFLGISTGVDYYYKSNKFANLTIGAATDFIIPFPAPVDHGDNYETMSSLYASVSDNYKFNRVSLGYGLSISRNTWAIREGMFNSELPQPTPVSKSNTAAGLVFSSYFQTGKSFNIGLVYRPTFVQFSSPKTLNYEHVLSLDLAWKFTL